MDDIVTRLRNWHTDHDSAVPRPIDLEAADEIERLRSEVARLTLVSSLWESEFVAAVDALKDKEVRGD